MQSVSGGNNSSKVDGNTGTKAKSLAALLKQKEEEITALEGQLRQTTQQLQSTRDALATSNRTTAVLLLCLVSGAALAYGHYRQHL